MEPHYTEEPNGWLKCTRCGRETKGMNGDASIRSMAEHLLSYHNIVIPAPGIPTEHGATFLPPDRNGLAPTQVKRFDHSSNLRPTKQTFHGF